MTSAATAAPTTNGHKPPKPPRMDVRADDIPAEMRAPIRWLLWWWDWKAKRGKWDKPPRTPSGAFGDCSDPGKWCSFDDAMRAYQHGTRFDGIGFALGDGFAGVDLDRVRDPQTGAIAPWARAIIDKLGTYAEVSPSGTGVKLLCRGTLGSGKRVAEFSDGTRLEMFDAGRYFTVTGHRLESSPEALADCTDALRWLQQTYIQTARRDDASGLTDREIAIEALGQLSGMTVCYHDWLHVGMALYSVDSSPAMLVEWDLWSQAAGDKYDPGACSAKWATFGGDGGSKIGIGSLIYWAKQTGWKPPRRKRTNAAGDDKRSDNEPPPFVTNATLDDEGQWSIPRPMRVILDDITRIGDGFPKRIGSALFVPSDNGVTWLESTESLFGWIGSRTLPPLFATGKGFHTKAETFAELRRTSPVFDAVESLPHEPPLPNHYYACESLPAGNGERLYWLLNRFNPATDIDRDLIQASLMTLLWGGPPGTRPAFVVTADEGRGSGKSKFVAMASELIGGHIELSANEDAGVIRQRLLSPEGLTKRLALLDNVKSHRFSWAELESLITAGIISGKRMYVGEAQRPNTLAWFITLNGVSLSTDLAQRAVVIKLAKPEFNPLWEEQTRAYIREHRRELLGDIITALRTDRTPLPRYSRWNAWERDVLSRLPDPSNAQAVIAERQQAVDVEGEEAAIIEDAFVWRLRELRYDVDTDRVFLPSTLVAKWLNDATGERLTTIAVSRRLAQLITEGTLRRLSVSAGRAHGRGFVWSGDQTEADTVTRTDIEQRIDRQAAQAGERF